jgi:hypothetical protein
MIFEPGYNNGPNRKYPAANVIKGFWWKKVSPDPWQTNYMRDWLVGILDRDMSVTNGYLDQIQYNTSWNGLSVWNMTSYPTDIFYNAKTQVLQGPMAVNFVRGEGNPSELYYMNGIVTSASDFGSPIYGYFDNSYRVMGVVGTQNLYPDSFQVWAQGGPALSTLIATAKEAMP